MMKEIMNISRHNSIKLRNVIYHHYVITSLRQRKPGLYFKHVIIKKKSKYVLRNIPKCPQTIFGNQFLFRSRFHQHIYTSFYARSSLKRKNSVKSSVSFTLLGSMHIKAALRTLMKLSSEWFNYYP